MKLIGVGLLLSMLALAMALFVSTRGVDEPPMTWLSAEKFTVYENQQCFDKTVQGETEKSCAQVSAKLLKTNLLWLNEFLENKAVETGKMHILESAQHLIGESDTPQKIFDLMLNSDYQLIKTFSTSDEMSESEYQYEQHYLGQRHNLLMFSEVLVIPIGRSADGIFEENYINIDLATQKQLALKDILIPNQEEMLSNYLEFAYDRYIIGVMMDDEQKAEEKLREHKEIYPSDNLIIENFLFTKNGLMFSYSPGVLDDSEKAPVELLVDWSSLEDILKPEYFW